LQLAGKHADILEEKNFLQANNLEQELDTRSQEIVLRDNYCLF